MRGKRIGELFGKSSPMTPQKTLTKKEKHTAVLLAKTQDRLAVFSFLSEEAAVAALRRQNCVKGLQELQGSSPKKVPCFVPLFSVFGKKQIFPHFSFLACFAGFFRKKLWKTLWKVCKTRLFRDFHFFTSCGKLFFFAVLNTAPRVPFVSVLARFPSSYTPLQFSAFCDILNK